MVHKPETKELVHNVNKWSPLAVGVLYLGPELEMV